MAIYPVDSIIQPLNNWGQIFCYILKAGLFWENLSKNSAYTLFWQLSINQNMDVQFQRCTYGNGATLRTLIFQGMGFGLKKNTRLRTKIV